MVNEVEVTVPLILPVTVVPTPPNDTVRGWDVGDLKPVPVTVTDLFVAPVPMMVGEAELGLVTVGLASIVRHDEHLSAVPEVGVTVMPVAPVAAVAETVASAVIAWPPASTTTFVNVTPAFGLDTVSPATKPNPEIVTGTALAPCPSGFGVIPVTLGLATVRTTVVAVYDTANHKPVVPICEPVMLAK
jgi:hypothetical protein